jgi:drug/metabolite transporter (DMT)-like permease
VTSDSIEQRRPAAPTRTDRIPLGILYMLGATILFACSSALSKWQVASHSVIDVLFLRSVTALAVCSLLILPRTGLIVFRTHRLRDHVGRNITQGLAQAAIVIAFGLMPLAGAVAINFAAPLVATVAAALLFKEKVGAVRWAVLLVGFFGVLVVAAPGADSFRIGALFAIANAVMYGSVIAAVRGMTATESAETLTMYQMVILIVMFAAMLPFGFTIPNLHDGLVMLANGLFYGFGQYLWTRSLSMAPTSAVGPFYYFSLVWAIVIGFVFWGDVPTPALLAGSAVVVGSGLFLLWHESGKKNGKKPLPVT